MRRYTSPDVHVMISLDWQACPEIHLVTRTRQRQVDGMARFSGLQPMPLSGYSRFRWRHSAHATASHPANPTVGWTKEERMDWSFGVVKGIRHLLVGGRIIVCNPCDGSGRLPTGTKCPFCRGKGER